MLAYSVALFGHLTLKDLIHCALVRSACVCEQLILPKHAHDLGSAMPL